MHSLWVYSQSLSTASGNRLFGSVVELWIIDPAAWVRFPPKSWEFFQPNYTPGIYAAGYIVFALTFVRSSVRMFVRSCVRSLLSVTFVEFTSKFLVKVSLSEYISLTTHQKAFIFEPWVP